jgi:ribonucleoside-diphosphate reductase alpha chain
MKSRSNFVERQFVSIIGDKYMGWNKSYNVKQVDGSFVQYTGLDIKHMIEGALQKGQFDLVSVDKLVDGVLVNMYDGIMLSAVDNLCVLSAIQYIEIDPQYGYAAARLLNNQIFRIVTKKDPCNKIEYVETYKDSFIHAIQMGVAEDLFDKRLLDFNLEFLKNAICLERDSLFKFLGLKTLFTRYLKACNKVIFEMPQVFWMRVAMGLALHEERKNEKAVEFYNMLSQLYFVSSTPTLLHSGLKRPQLSSCFLSFIDDDLIHIFKCIGDNAQMSKWSGGVANDWSALRGSGSWIKTINTTSQGTIPFLKVANDTTAAINRSGSRRGAVVAYMECWHYDFEDFLDLRKNTGDDRRRTHDMNTASWIPDLFMKRMLAGEQWTLFSPHEAPELHELYGQAFEKKYAEYEAKAAAGEMEMIKIIPAKDLWRKMLTRLFETGHPWITFKDACNVRSPQDHDGIVHSSNLCTEITLNTSREETAVCNLGSINFAKCIQDKKIDEQHLAQVVETGMRMLDNVIDINFYPTIEGQTSNSRHRPVGLGVMGLQDALFQMDISFDSPEALEVSDKLTEIVSYYAILNSSKLAQERGKYSSYAGSKWDRGIFPIDTIELLSKERGEEIPLLGKVTKDWTSVREHVAKYGMRNSNTMAIAPTATISNISGSYPCIEPIYKNIYAKANLSGEYAVLNDYLVEDLKKEGLWSQEMSEQIKYFDGSVQNIASIPSHLKKKYKTAFEIDSEWLVKITAARGKWVDQSQSHNVFMQGVSGKKMHDLYVAGWKLGLKTFYYLRSLGATQIEKSTLDAKKYGYTQMRTQKTEVDLQADEEITLNSCSLIDTDCDSCQ